MYTRRISWSTHRAHCHEQWQMQMSPYEKQTKPHLPRSLRKNVSPAEAIRTPSTCIIDGMGLVQRMNGINKTFAHLTQSVLSMVLYVGVHNGGDDVVFDAYRQPSIKDSDRLNRGASTSVRIVDSASTTLQYKCLQGDTTYSSGDNSCAVPSTRRASSSWMARETTAIQICAAW